MSKPIESLEPLPGPRDRFERLWKIVRPGGVDTPPDVTSQTFAGIVYETTQDGPQLGTIRTKYVANVAGEAKHRSRIIELMIGTCDEGRVVMSDTTACRQNNGQGVLFILSQLEKVILPLEETVTP
jgi:hypothetical protein